MVTTSSTPPTTTSSTPSPTTTSSTTSAVTTSSSTSAVTTSSTSSTVSSSSSSSVVSSSSTASSSSSPATTSSSSVSSSSSVTPSSSSLPTSSSSSTTASSSVSSTSSTSSSSVSSSSAVSSSSSTASSSSSATPSSSSVSSSSSLSSSSTVPSSSATTSSSSAITSSGTSTLSSSTVSSSGSTTSSGAVSTGTCTSVPSPPSLVTLSCSDPAYSGIGFVGEYTDQCANRYQVYCGRDTSPGAVSTTTASSINECMLKCDAYTGCGAAVLDGNTCYLKASFAGLITSGQSATKAALVRYIPPNPNYAAPVAATGGGCGKPLPSNITANGASVQFGMTPSDGIPRTYLVHIPQYYDINKASPIIFAYHGNGGTATRIQDQTRFNDASMNPFAIAVYVNGTGSGQSGYESNPGYGSTASTDPPSINNQIRDRDFLKQLVLNMKDTFCIDSSRIFATGQSNGGGFCGVIACDRELSVTFAAIAPNSGAFYSGTAPGTAGVNPDNVITDTPGQIPCSPGRLNMPIFETHGTQDPTISYYGNPARGSPARIIPSIPRWLNAWAERQRIPTKNYTTNLAPRVNLVQWADETGELGRLQHFQLIDWVHDWPDGKGSAPIDVSPYIMDFFYRWTNPNRAKIYAPPDNSTTSSSSVTSSTTSSTRSSTLSSSTVSSSSSLATSSSSSSLVVSTSSSSSVASSSSSSLTRSSSSTAPSSVSCSIFLF